MTDLHQTVSSVQKQKEEKYLVLKLADIENILTMPQQTDLWACCEEIRLARMLRGKKKNHYIVVNDNEPYADRIWDMILEGPKAWKPLCFNQYEPGMKECLECHLSQRCFDETYGKGPTNLPGSMSR